MSASLNYLNLGCGTRYDPLWINMDAVQTGPGVIAHDLSRGIPLADDTCDVVYHSHFLEHLRRADALSIMKECHRVLKPGGILRVVVPDLEGVCRTYLQKLDEALKGDLHAQQDHEWMMLELYDQAVREHWRSGMHLYLKQRPIPNEAFVRHRIGMFDEPDLSEEAGGRPRVVPLLRGAVARVVDRLLWLKPVRAWWIGRFRLRGEVHHWMYDRFSLAQLMLSAGFENPTRQTAERSAIPDWASYNLDTSPQGTIRKANSLFMEATKPLRY